MPLLMNCKTNLKTQVTPMTHVPTIFHAQTEQYVIYNDNFPLFLANCGRLEKQLSKHFNYCLYTVVNFCTCQNKQTSKNLSCLVIS